MPSRIVLLYLNADKSHCPWSHTIYIATRNEMESSNAVYALMVLYFEV